MNAALKPVTPAAVRCPSYYSATLNEETDYPPLQGEVSVDVVIIGGGFTGVASAVELAERGLKVAIVEANKIGWGATGRNGGQELTLQSVQAALMGQNMIIVGDGRPHLPYLMLWRFRDGGFEGPRMLCWHRGSAHVQAVHVHPRLTPDGAAVLYTSDESGYGNVYLAALPAFESLMTLEQWDRSPRKPWVPFAWVKPR